MEETSQTGCSGEQFKLPEARLRDKEIGELDTLFRSYGYNIPLRSIKFLHRRSSDPCTVNMRAFMDHTGYACCDETIEILRQAYDNWVTTRIPMEEFLRRLAEETPPDPIEEKSDVEN
jgi:hypothetical protein